jgi:hypothetical protein
MLSPMTVMPFIELIMASQGLPKRSVVATDSTVALDCGPGLWSVNSGSAKHALPAKHVIANAQ